MVRFPPFRVGDRSDLSVPKGAPARGSLYDADAFGRFAETLARFLGTGRYLVGQTAFVIFWIILNIVAGVRHWDPYPFILLNLALSFQAAYAAPIIMMSQTRQADIDRKAAENDYKINIKAELEIESLHQKLDQMRELEILRLTEEVRALTDLLRQSEANHGRRT
ncbi:MAG: DUF1003 domain-containing protein [Rhizomicrobium sp.]